MNSEKHTFQAEVGNILDIVAHSLYSQKEVFLRELISNASDACDKLRYESISNANLLKTESDFKIELYINSKEGSLIISDNGIGMNKDDLMDSLGTIARSGTKAFLEDIKNNPKNDKNTLTSLIGQFGVGFYSAFMVSEKVEVLTKKAGDNDSWIWSSDGKGEFEITSGNKENCGTDVILYINKSEKEYLDPVRIENIIKKYSDHIAHPVILKSSKKSEDDRTINSASALWVRNKKDITKDQYKEFYHHVGMAFDEPWMILHNKAEGILSYTNLLYIPSTRPFDIFHAERKSNIKLYIKRVYITDDCEELIPPYLRFIKGIVDSEDIDLNVSREMLQHNAAILKIKKALVKRILSELQKSSQKDKDNYEKFWQEFGMILKEGIHEDFQNKDQILDLTRFRSSYSSEWTSLSEYIERMQKGQEKIFYISGPSIDQISQSPQLEGFKSKNIEVLYMIDPVDEFWIPGVGAYKEKSFQSATRGKIDLDDIKTTKDSKDTTSNDKKESHGNKDILLVVDNFKKALENKVKDVRISDRLTESPVCLVAEEGDMDIHLEKLYKQHKQIEKESLRVLEINSTHPIIMHLSKIVKNKNSDDKVFENTALLLFDQAKILEGQPVDDPKGFTQRMTEFMQSSLK